MRTERSNNKLALASVASAYVAMTTCALAQIVAPAPLLPAPMEQDGRGVQPVVDGVAAEAPLSQEFDRWLDSKIAELDSPDVAVREAATEEIDAKEELTLSVIENRLGGAAGQSLSAEQTQRLMNLGLRRFAQEPRAALGVQFSRSGIDGQGVEVGSCVVGFDSKRVLRPADLIAEMAGTTIQSVVMMRAVIVSHDPGQAVPIVVMRRGERLSLTVALGNYEDLSRGSANPLDDVLTMAWELRRGRAVGRPTIEPTVHAELPENRWDDLSRATMRAMLMERRELIRKANGGMQVLSMDESENFPAVVPSGSMRNTVAEPVAEFTANIAQDIVANQIVFLRQQAAGLNGSILAKQAMLRQNNLQPENRRAVEQQIAREKVQLQELRAKLRTMQAPIIVRP